MKKKLTLYKFFFKITSAVLYILNTVNERFIMQLNILKWNNIVYIREGYGPKIDKILEMF